MVKEENMVKKIVCFGEQVVVLVIGLGIWYMGEYVVQCQQEVVVLCVGIDYGLMVIDMVEMYVDGGVEEVVGQVICGLCDWVVLVFKVYFWYVGKVVMYCVCENSLCWLQIDYFDMYFLYWCGDILLQEMVEVMEKLVVEGKICCWGVFNLDIEDMQVLWWMVDGEYCVINQVFYYFVLWGIEYDFLFWCQQYSLLVMVYCLLVQVGCLCDGFFQYSDIINMVNVWGIMVV